MSVKSSCENDLKSVNTRSNLYIYILILNERAGSKEVDLNGTWKLKLLKAFIGVETVPLTFKTKQYITSYSGNVCYGKRFYNDFF